MLAVADSHYDEFREQLYAGTRCCSAWVGAGLLGRKTGRGCFDYQGRAAGVGGEAS